MSGGDVGESIEIRRSQRKDLTGWSPGLYNGAANGCQLQYYSTFRNLSKFSNGFGFFTNVHILQTESKMGGPDGNGIGG